ncbi:MAG TPA: Fe-S cluster assembly protein SufD, partial [Luteimonas sp.]|nr:Fe-S cluster assembly protein SufD [Luteimonas sp.]
MTSPLLESLASGFSGDAARRALLDAALRDGLPGARSERWKYTPLRALERRSFAAADDAPAIDPGLLADIPSPRLVFVNGRYDAALSQFDALPEGVQLAAGEAGEPVAAADATGDAPLAPGDAVFARLNAALAQTGVRLRADAGAQVERPVHLVFAGAAGAAEALAWHLHHRVEVGAGAALRVVEHHLAAGEHRHLDTATLSVSVAQDALLEHARVQRAADGATS